MTVKDNMSQISEMGNKSFERMNALGELNLKVWEKLAARQMETANLMMEQSARQVKLATESKGYTEFVQGQVELAKEVSERMMAEAQNTMQLANQVRDEYRAWFERGVADVTAEVRKASSTD